MSEPARPDRSHLPRLLALAGIAVGIGIAVSILLAVAFYVVLLVLGSGLEGVGGSDVEGLLVVVLVVVGGVIAYAAGRVAGYATVRLGDPPGARLAVIVPLALFAVFGGWGGVSGIFAPLWLELLIKAVMLALVVLGVSRAGRRRGVSGAQP